MVIVRSMSGLFISSLCMKHKFFSTLVPASSKIINIHQAVNNVFTPPTPTTRYVTQTLFLSSMPIKMLFDDPKHKLLIHKAMCVVCLNMMCCFITRMCLLYLCIGIPSRLSSKMCQTPTTFRITQSHSWTSWATGTTASPPLRLLRKTEYSPPPKCSTTSMLHLQ